MKTVPFKYLFQIAQDIVLTLIFLILMGFYWWGDAVHEWSGIIFLLLIFSHIGLSAYWFKKLTREPITLYRGVQLTLNIILAITFITVMVSGLMLSQHAVPTLPIHSDSGNVRNIHMISAYWMLVILGMHLGQHWNMLKHFISSWLSINTTHFVYRIVLPFIWGSLSIYGLYQFIEYDISSYLLGKIVYSYFDTTQPLWSFYFDFFSIFIFLAYITHLFICLFHRK